MPAAAPCGCAILSVSDVRATPRNEDDAARAPAGLMCGPVRSKNYGNDVLAGDWRRPRKGLIPEVPAEPGLVAEDPDSGFCGAVVACDKSGVTLEDRFGKRRVFPLTKSGFLIDGRPVTLVRPEAAPGKPARSASGSIAVQGLRARVAKESRIYVEGVHDAELVEKIWGHDLRVEGVVVEYLEGVDGLPAIVEEFAPDEGRRPESSSTTSWTAPRSRASPRGSPPRTCS